MEVVLALLLFVGAAAIISGSLSTSVNSVERLRLQTHADNLAATVMAEIQLGLHPLNSTGPTSFEPPFADWTWELLPAATIPFDEETSRYPLRQVEVVVRHVSEPVVFRLNQIMALDTIRQPVDAESLSPESTTSPTPPPIESTPSPEEIP